MLVKRMLFLVELSAAVNQDGRYPLRAVIIQFELDIHESFDLLAVCGVNLFNLDHLFLLMMFEL